MALAGPSRCQSSTAQRSRQAIGDHFPAAAQRLPRLPNVSAADALEDGVDPVARQTPNLRHEVLVLVIDWYRAEVPHRRSLSGGAGAIHLELGETTQLEQRCADAACSAMNEHPLTDLYARRPMHHLVRGDVIQEESHSLRRVEPGRHRNDL